MLDLKASVCTCTHITNLTFWPLIQSVVYTLPMNLSSYDPSTLCRCSKYNHRYALLMIAIQIMLMQ